MSNDLLSTLARLRVARGAPPPMSDAAFLETLMPAEAPGMVRVTLIVDVNRDGVILGLYSSKWHALAMPAGCRRSVVTALVPLPEPAAEVVGEVSGG